MTERPPVIYHEDWQTWHSIKDVSRLLRLNERVVRRWVREGQLLAENVGGRVGYRISPQALDRFLTDRRARRSTQRPQPDNG